MDKKPEIYKSKINKLKSEVQKEYYYHFENKEENITQKSKEDSVDKTKLLNKINAIFKRNDYVYQASVNIILKNNNTISKKIIGIMGNDLLTLDKEKINIDDIYDIEI